MLYRYMDDTFVIWPHCQDKLHEFLNHLNGLHKKIQFTVETEKDGHLPFLDIDTYRKTDCSLCHKIYRKPTHTNLYLQQNSHHHPANNQSSHPWYKELKVFVTKTPFHKNWNS
jgi:hypothetical protein